MDTLLDTKLLRGHLVKNGNTPPRLKLKINSKFCKTN
jgi:hypothetical protein